MRLLLQDLAHGAVVHAEDVETACEFLLLNTADIVNLAHLGIVADGSFYTRLVVDVDDHMLGPFAVSADNGIIFIIASNVNSSIRRFGNLAGLFS